MMLEPKPLSPELAALIEKAKSHVMTADERRAQRVSFVYGLLGDEDTRSKEDIAKWLDEHEGRVDVSTLEATILRLTAERDRAREALKPFAQLEMEFSSHVTDDTKIGLVVTSILEPTVGDLRKARSVREAIKS